MSEQKTDPAKKKGPVLDRWNLRPAPPGVVRGRARNIRESEQVGPYGQMRVVDFDLWIDEGVPAVPVRMTGTDFQNRVMEDMVLDAPDPDPAVRPVAPWRVKSSHNPDYEVIAHYPGREFAVQSRGLAWTVMVILAPFRGGGAADRACGLLPALVRLEASATHLRITEGSASPSSAADRTQEAVGLDLAARVAATSTRCAVRNG